MSCRNRRTRVSKLPRAHQGDRVSWNLTRAPPPQFILWAASEWPRPSLYPKHQRFMTQLLTTGLKHNTEAVLTPPRFTVWSFEQRALPPSTQHAHKSGDSWRTDEASISSIWAGPWGEESRAREEETVNLTPFTPFKSPFSSESRVKITLWLRLWSCSRTQHRADI